MRQIWFPRAGAPDVMEIREAPDPVPGPGQVRIAVEAAGVNFADLMARMGVYQDAPPFPFVVGYEVAGTIDAVGEGVDASKVGTPVVAMTRFGGYSTSVVVDEIQATRRPEGIDAVTGAAIPVTGLTAWMMIDVFGRVREGDRVLVHSAGGGVGLMALDLLKERGAFVGGTASARKHPFLVERGYDRLVDYRTQDFEAELADVGGFDLILDAVGGDSWRKSLNLLRPGGRLSAFGVSTQATSDKASFFDRIKLLWQIPWLAMSPVSLINRNVGVVGVNMGRMWDEGERVAGWLDQLLTRVEDGRLRVQVHEAVPFDEAPEAHALIHRRENIGKVVLKVG